MRGREEKKISVEDYLDFFDSQKQLPLNANFLNQIISMHGFKKIYNQPKKALIDAVGALDLMNPSRSTLKGNDNDSDSDNGICSSCAFMDLEEIIADLNHLKWQDCCATSIQTITSSKHTAHSSSSVPSAGRERKRKRGSRAGGFGSGDAYSSGSGLVSLGSC